MYNTWGFFHYVSKEMILLLSSFWYFRDGFIVIRNNRLTHVRQHYLSSLLVNEIFINIFGRIFLYTYVICPCFFFYIDLSWTIFIKWLIPFIAILVLCCLVYFSGYSIEREKPPLFMKFGRKGMNLCKEVALYPQPQLKESIIKFHEPGPHKGPRPP